MPTTYELYNYSVAKYGVYNATTIALREKLDSEIALANGNAQLLARMLPYDAQIPKKFDDDRTSEELIEAALAPDKTSTDVERVELFETFAEETLPIPKAKQATEQYKKDISGKAGSGENLSWLERQQTLEDEETYWHGRYLGGERLEDIFDILRTGEYAAGGYLLRIRQLKDYVDKTRREGRKPSPLEVSKRLFGAVIEGPSYGIEHRVSPSAALEIEGFLAGLAVDILYDPTTYLSFGGTGVIKIAARAAPKAAAKLGIREGGKIALKKGGRDTLERLIQGGMPLKKAEETIVEWMATHPEDAAKWMHKGGLRWMGQTVIPGRRFEQAWAKVAGLRYVGAPIEAGVTGIAAIPTAISAKIRKTVTGTAGVLGEALVPGYWMKQLPGKYGEYFTDYLDWVLRKRGAMAQEFHKLKVMAEPFKKRGEEITKYIESTSEIMETITPDPFLKGVKLGKLDIPETTGDKALDEFIESVVKSRLAAMREAEVAREIGVGEVAGYVPHVLTKKGEKFLKRVGGIPEAYKYYAQKVRAPYAEERLWQGTIEEINKSFGFEFFEPNFWKAMAVRTKKHVADIYTADWFKHVQKEYGIDELVDATRVGIDFVESRHPQIERLLPRRIAQHLEEIVDEPATGFIANRAAEYDWAMTWWKRSVTTGFGLLVHPAFFARNVYSGVYQNWMRTGMYSPLDYYHGIKARFGRGTFKTLERGKISGTEMQDLLREQGIMGQPGMMDVILENVWDRTLWQKMRDIPSWFMTETENLVRIPEFVKLAERMSIRQARDVTFETHFAYLPEFHTKVEMEAAKRLFPFWTWMSRNIPFQIQRMIEQPRKLAGVGKFQQKLIEKYGMEEEYERRTDWQRQMFLIPNIFKGGEGWVGLGLPFLDLTTDIGDLYFALSPVKLIPELGYIEQDWGSREYKTKKQTRAIKRALEGRYGTTARRLVRTEEDIDRMMYLAGMPTYDLAPEDVQSMFEAARWREPSPTKEQEYAAWVAAGAPEGYRIKTLVAPPGGVVGMEEVVPDPKWWEVWKKPPVKPEPPLFELLALPEHVYERAKGLQLTPEQIRYVLTGREEVFPEFTPIEPPIQTIFDDAMRRAYELPGSREMRYEELLVEWERFQAGEIQPEYPTLEQRMESWERAGEPEEYIQKIYRDEIGKLIGVITYTPEELEEMKGFQPSEAQLKWAFREEREILPKEQIKLWKEVYEETGFRPTEAQMEWATTTEWLEVGGVKKKMTFDEQMEYFSKEYEAEQEQNRLMREELIELREDPIGKTRSQKGIPAALMLTRGAQDIQTRISRSEELENLLGTGVDR